uniref:NADH dehydrogenase subunit 4L n=1 Tax=Optediceros sp. TaxID=3114356 RepID=UPI002E768D8D|nr:NADH dehydrogenase subunit 4L [Optediceros sp.]WPR14850.1 NADH dehydrogenase subunit 4L [Optediceros sp.]
MSLFYLSLISMLSFFLALITLSLQYKHLLNILLSLEAVTMSLFILLFTLMNNISYSGEMALILITLGACEASLGLSILVSMIRMRGNDYVSSFSSQKC